MRNRRRGLAGVTAIAALSLAAAACGGGGGGGSSTSTSSGSPVKGGNFKIASSSDVDHLDTASGYYTVTYTFFRAFTRQLTTYVASDDPTTAAKVVPDVATEVPTPTNDGKTYTITLRDGVQWNTKPARAVTSQDFKLGFKRLCNPVQPTGAPGYFTGTIVGMKAYCDGFTKVKPDVASMKAYINGNDIPGIKTPDAKTIEFDLLQPASDFINILAMPFSSAAPVEYLNYVPDSPQFRTNTISDGPYAVSKYVLGKELDMVRNPAWQQSSDPVRHAYVDTINTTIGLDDEAIQQQAEAGTIDWGIQSAIPTARLTQLIATNNTQLSLNPFPNTQYVVMNSESTKNKALQNVKVRQAINYAINKAAIIQILGGPKVGIVQNTILPSTILGYKAANVYATPSDQGDTAKAKQLLSEAGYGSGLSLTFIYRSTGNSEKYATSIQTDLAKVGIKLNLKVVPPADFYTKWLQTPDAAKNGSWDMAFPGWFADWPGNGARTYFVPLLDGRNCGQGSTNYGCFNDPQVNSLIDKALSAPTLDEAESNWSQADQQAMSVAAWVPVFTQNIPLYTPKPTKGFEFFAFAEGPDLTNIWLQS